MQHLKRDIGLFEATIYGLGGIIGAGIYVLIGKTAGIAGNSLWLSFLLAAVIAALSGLSYAELSSTFPVDSAEYRFSRMAFKDRRFSFGIGWLKMFTMIIVAAAVSLGFGNYLHNMLGINHIFGAFGLIMLIMILNLLGLKKALWVDVGFVLITIAGLAVIIVTGFQNISSVNHLALDTGWSGLLSGASLIFFAFIGFETISNLGGEIKNPKKTLPRAVLLSIIICTLLYVLVALVATSTLSSDVLAQSRAPLSDIVMTLLGTNWAVILSVIALFATASTVFAVYVSATRMGYGLSAEHSFPTLFRKLNRFDMPWIPIVLAGLIISLIILKGELTFIAFLADFGALFTLLTVNIAMIVLRYTQPEAKRGFKVPFHIGKFPILPALGAIFCMWFLAQLDKKVFLIGILLILLGIVLYMMFWENKHQKREMHIKLKDHTKKYVQPIAKEERLVIERKTRPRKKIRGQVGAELPNSKKARVKRAKTKINKNKKGRG